MTDARDETLANDLHDVVTHRASWRAALIECRERSKSFTDDADESYWEHELKAFDRTFDKLAALRAAPQAPDTERSPTNDKPLHPTNGPFRWDPKHGNWVADLNGVFDLLAEQDRERERHAGQVSRLMAERDELRAALSRPPHVADTREGDFMVDDSILARRILTYLGRSGEASLEPGVDRHRDHIAGMICADREARALASGADEKGRG